MSRHPASLFDLAVSAGAPPKGVPLPTYLIATLPPEELTAAARRSTPSYDRLITDKKNGGQLLQFMQENPMPEASLGSDILVAQQRLSRIRRHVATLAFAGALMLGGTAAGYHTLTEFDKDMNVHTTDVDRLERGAMIGALAGTSGGFVTLFATLGLSGRLARGPARKIVKRAEARQGSQD